MLTLGIVVTDGAITRHCEWCGRATVALNRNGVKKRYCSRDCKGAFQAAAVECMRYLLQEGRISLTEFKAIARTAADAREAKIASSGIKANEPSTVEQTVVLQGSQGEQI